MTEHNTSRQQPNYRGRRVTSLKMKAARHPRSSEGTRGTAGSVTAKSPVAKAFGRRAQAAVSYAKTGYAVLPLHTIRNGNCTCAKGAECNRAGKHPLLSGGYKGATADVAQVKQIWCDHRTRISVSPQAKSPESSRLMSTPAMAATPRYSSSPTSLVVFRLRSVCGLAVEAPITCSGIPTPSPEPFTRLRA